MTVMVAILALELGQERRRRSTMERRRPCQDLFSEDLREALVLLTRRIFRSVDV